ncbi:MAG: pitrilysin family protein [Flavobacteriales bacterium]
MRYALSLAVTFLTPALMTAQVDRSKAPRPGPPPTVQLGQSKQFTLANGMHVIVVENHKLPMVSVQARFDIPPILQGDIAGYQDLVGELIASGTTTRTKEQIDEQVDGLGATLAGNADGVYASCLKKNFPQVMALVQDVVENATYPQAEFEKAKTRAISGIQTRADDPDQISEVVGRALMFGKGHPYGEVVTEKTMSNVGRDAVYNYYRYFFQPKDGYLVFVGDITEAEAKALAEKHFGSWTGAQVPGVQQDKGQVTVPGLGKIVPAVPGVPVTNSPLRVAFVDRPGSAQSVVRVIFPVDLRPNDPMAQTSQVLNTILGGGVFNARLMQNLREDKAYTYGAYSSLDPDRWAGSFSAGCSVRNQVTDSAAVELLGEVARIQQAPVSADELSLTKSYMAGSFARSLEDPRTIARFALNTILNQLPADYYATYLKRLDTVSVSSVQAAAKRFLHPDHAVLLVVGDKAQVADGLKRLSPTGTVEFYDINGDPFKRSLRTRSGRDDGPAGARCLREGHRRQGRAGQGEGPPEGLLRHHAGHGGDPHRIQRRTEQVRHGDEDRRDGVAKAHLRRQARGGHGHGRQEGACRCGTGRGQSQQVHLPGTAPGRAGSHLHVEGHHADRRQEGLSARGEEGRRQHLFRVLRRADRPETAQGGDRRSRCGRHPGDHGLCRLQGRGRHPVPAHPHAEHGHGAQVRGFVHRREQRRQWRRVQGGLIRSDDRSEGRREAPFLHGAVTVAP